jgi:hypothetical protein
MPTVRSATQTALHHSLGNTGNTPPSKPNGFNRLTLAINDKGMNEKHVAMKDGPVATRVPAPRHHAQRGASPPPVVAALLHSHTACVCWALPWAT